MRTYGRVVGDDGVKRWVLVETDPNGFDDPVWLTTLVQVLNLNLGESPFYADWGIPAKPSVIQQIFPDFYVSRTQQRFAPHFAAVIIAKLPLPDPTYRVMVTTNQGATVVTDVPR